MRKNVLLVALVVALLLTLAAPTLAASGGEAVDQATNWLKNQQNADGGFSNGFSPESSLAATAEAVVALAAGGHAVEMVQSADGASSLDYLRQQVRAGQVEGVGVTAKVVLALVAANQNPTNFAGHNLIGQIEAAYDAASGSYGGSVFDQALVILALANAGRTAPEGAIDYVTTHQTTDGAWNFMGDTTALSGDTNTTALVIQALVAVGRKDDTGRALDYLRRVQNADAGWPYQNPSAYGTETDANSTALVIEAIYAVGQTPADWYVDGADPLGVLLALQNPSGSFSYQASFGGDNSLATIQAIPAVAGVTLANVPRAPAAGETPAAEATAPPLLLPESGAVSTPTPGVFVAIGLLLVTIGLGLRLSWRKQASS